MTEPASIAVSNDTDGVGTVTVAQPLDRWEDAGSGIDFAPRTKGPVGKGTPPTTFDSSRTVSFTVESETGSGGSWRADDPGPRGTDPINEQRFGTYPFSLETQIREVGRLHHVLYDADEFTDEGAFEKRRYCDPFVVVYGMDHLDRLDATDPHDHVEELP